MTDEQKKEKIKRTLALLAERPMPWTLNEQGQYIDANGVGITYALEITHRMIDCVNAMGNIPDPEAYMENIRNLGLDECVKQRAELQAAHERSEKVMHAAQEAIGKLEELHKEARAVDGWENYVGSSLEKSVAATIKALKEGGTA